MSIENSGIFPCKCLCPQEKNTFWSWNFQAAIFKLKCIFRKPGSVWLEHINSRLFKSFALPMKPHFPTHTPCLTQVCFPVYHPVYANHCYIDLQHCEKCNIIHWWPDCPNPCVSTFDCSGKLGVEFAWPCEVCVSTQQSIGFPSSFRTRIPSSEIPYCLNRNFIESCHRIIELGIFLA
jgi:hypothetical protein